MDVDTLTVREDYYRKNGPSSEVERKKYELKPVSKGTFELSVARRGEYTEDAVYSIRINGGVYMFRIVFSTEITDVVDSSSKATKWIDYTENPADID